MRVATDSRIDRVEEDDRFDRAPRLRNSCAKGASKSGASASAEPGSWRAKASIQLTDCTRMNTCQKQVATAKRNTPAIKPFSQGFVWMMPKTVSWMSQAPPMTRPETKSMVTIWRMGWLKRTPP